MNDKSEFQELRSRITSFLRNSIRWKTSDDENKVPAFEKAEVQREPVLDILPDTTPRTDPKEITSSISPLSKGNIASFREKIEQGFAETQAATSPWIILGLDLGTSSTKVVWRGETNVVPVCFGTDALRLESYLAPSVVTFKGDELLIGNDAVSETEFPTVSNFKMCLACVSQGDGKCGLNKCSLTSWPIDHFCRELKDLEIQFVNATFLGKLIADSKRIVKAELQRTFRQGARPKWTANFAVPETFIERSPIADEFRKMLRIAWLMSEIFVREPRYRNLTTLFECFVAAKEVANQSLEILEDEEFGCSIYPEVGAEVASIVMSKLSEEGLYAFVDIGAGTIDASLFNYFREKGKPNRPPYAANVSKELGAAQIEIRASRNSIGGMRFPLQDLRKIKEEYNSMNRDEKSAVNSQFRLIKHIADELAPKIQEFLQQVFREARDEKDDQIVNSKIRLVLGGGGSHLNTYRKAAFNAFTIKHRKNPVPPEVTILQKPGDFQMPLPASEFHRFAVAYGLSFPIDSLPDMVFPKDVLKKANPRRSEKNYGSIYEK